MRQVNPEIHSRFMSKRSKTEMLWAYILIAPVVLGLFVFYLLPAMASFVLSFTEWDGLTTPSFIGFENFMIMMEDDTFVRSVVNTIMFTLGSVPFSVALAIVVSVLLNQSIKGLGIYRTLYFIPVVTMPVAVGMVWRWLYNSEYGLINYLLGLVNIPAIEWLFDERFALLSIILVSIWMSIGFNIVILIAGLQGISSTYYEVASIDGAGPLHKFFKITLPLLTPSIFFVLVMSLINSLQVFDLIFVMMGNNSAMLDPTRTVVYSVWEHGFQFFNMGYASAQAYFLFVFILVVTIIQFYFQKRWVHYQ